jgi:acyl transferase domain-containing protein
MNTAIQALQNDEITAAIVGGVTVLENEDGHRLFHQRRILSPDPMFHIFDQRAQGIVLGEGVGLVLLKTLDRAIGDGDTIYAVIKGLAINNDGRTAGPATPNPRAQKEVLETALAKSGKRPEEISYIEVNGSGSEVTDLLELKTIQRVYRADGKSPCELGSIKPNIGHTLSAEGIAAFIKVVLTLYHRKSVPFLSGLERMTHFNMETSPFYFSRSPKAWEGSKRIAAINCFADGGTNAHVILEERTKEHLRPVIRCPAPPPVLHTYDLRKRIHPHHHPEPIRFWGQIGTEA